MHEDTIVALSTAQGISAIAVIRLSGENCFTVVQKSFRGDNLSEQPSHTIHFGTFWSNDKLIDEVLVSVF